MLVAFVIVCYVFLVAFLFVVWLKRRDEYVEVVQDASMDRFVWDSNTEVYEEISEQENTSIPRPSGREHVQKDVL